MKKIGIIGFGNMGAAFAKGIKGKAQYEIFVSEKKEAAAANAKEICGFTVIPLPELVKTSDIIVIAVKPQELPLLFRQIAPFTHGKRIISIAAGKKIGFFEKELNTDTVARFMPNLAAAEGKALVGVSFGGRSGGRDSEYIDDDFKSDCLSIAEAVGTPFVIPESLMPAITGLSGSGIAFVFSFIHAMTLGGVSCGIAYQDALSSTLKIINGAVAVMEKTGEHPIGLLSKVISPAGTTIRGVAALEAGGFTSSVIQAIEDATERAKELEG